MSARAVRSSQLPSGGTPPGAELLRDHLLGRLVNAGEGTHLTALRDQLVASCQLSGKTLAQLSFEVGQTAVPRLQGRRLVHELGTRLDDAERECGQLGMGQRKRRSQPHSVMQRVVRGPKLHYLQRLPVDTIKIDKSFIDPIRGPAEGTALSEVVLKLAQALDLRTVAEGIENTSQLDALRQMGCEWAQGFALAPPVPLAELEAACETATRAVLSRPQR